VNASDEFARVEGFYEVIIGAAVEKCNAAGGFFDFGYDQYWRGDLRAAQLFAQGLAVDVGQGKLGNDARVSGGKRLGFAFLASMCRIDNELF